MINYDDFQLKEDPNAEKKGFYNSKTSFDSWIKKYAPVIVVLAIFAFILYKAGAFDTIIDRFSGASDVAITVTNKTSYPSNWSEGIVGDHIRIDLSVKNSGKKVIRGIEGKLIIYDLFDKELMKEQADITGHLIKVGESININFMFRANSLIEKEVKAFNTDYKDLKFTYKVTKIVYK